MLKLHEKNNGGAKKEKRSDIDLSVHLSFFCSIHIILAFRYYKIYRVIASEQKPIKHRPLTYAERVKCGSPIHRYRTNINSSLQFIIIILNEHHIYWHFSIFI